MYIKYIDEWLHPCVRWVDSISIRSAEVEEDDGTVTEGAELYDPARGNGFRADNDSAAFRWFSSWAVARKMLDKLCAALDAGKQFYDLTALVKMGNWRGLMQKNNQPQQLCWSRQNAVPSEDGRRGCEWSRDLRPVPGWDAELVHKSSPGTTWCIKSCPKYRSDPPRLY